MDKPVLDLGLQGREDFYAIIGRVSLRLIERNVDAITVANFLREILVTGGEALDTQQVLAIARNYVDFTN
jgi:hypothetical protein